MIQEHDVGNCYRVQSDTAGCFQGVWRHKPAPPEHQHQHCKLPEWADITLIDQRVRMTNSGNLSRAQLRACSKYSSISKWDIIFFFSFFFPPLVSIYGGTENHNNNNNNNKRGKKQHLVRTQINSNTTERYLLPWPFSSKLVTSSLDTFWRLE